MRMFVWKYVSELTNNYHNGGGLLVVAPDLFSARVWLKTRDDIPVDCEAYEKAPDIERECEGPEIVVVFQDAGCC